MVLAREQSEWQRKSLLYVAFWQRLNCSHKIDGIDIKRVLSRTVTV